MFGQKFYPYSTLQELNLDWILTKVKNILRFVPDDGVVGQILRRTPDGAEWSNETGGGGAVDSVNGQTGTVVLTASDVGALPDSYTPTFPVTSVNNKTGAVSLTASDVGALPDSYTPPVTSVNTKTGAVVLDKTDVGLGNVANVAQYSASNPPPYPVTSVNGMTGAVVISGGGAVDSVNGYTGDVVLTAADVGAWSKLGTADKTTYTSFPFTAPEDGILYYRFAATSSSSPSWAYILNTDTNFYIAQAYTDRGVAVAGHVIVKKGWTLTNPTKQNCSLTGLMFIPFE